MRSRGRRVWIEVSDRPIGPDVHVVRPRKENPEPGGSMTLVDRPIAKRLLIHVPNDECVEPLIESYLGRVPAGDR